MCLGMPSCWRKMLMLQTTRFGPRAPCSKWEGLISNYAVPRMVRERDHGRWREEGLETKPFAALK